MRSHQKNRYGVPNAHPIHPGLFLQYYSNPQLKITMFPGLRSILSVLILSMPSAGKGESRFSQSPTWPYHKDKVIEVCWRMMHDSLGHLYFPYLYLDRTIQIT